MSRLHRLALDADLDPPDLLFGLGSLPLEPALFEPGAHFHSLHASVPEGVRPGEDFVVHINIDSTNRYVFVKCPPSARPGDVVQFRVGPEDLHAAPITSAASGAEADAGTLPLERYSSFSNYLVLEELDRIQQLIDNRKVEVTMPPDARPGDFHRARTGIGEETVMVQFPKRAWPTQKFQFAVPPAPSHSHQPQIGTSVADVVTKSYEFDFKESESETWSVSDQGFSCLVSHGGQVGMLRMRRPPSVRPGQKVRFTLQVTRPLSMRIKMTYESLGSSWARTVRVVDSKFQWMRDSGHASGSDGCFFRSPFSTDCSAFVSTLFFLEGNDKRMRTGVLKLVPASEVASKSSVRDELSREMHASQNDIVSAQGYDFPTKKSWFSNICSRLALGRSEGAVEISVRREFLLEDSMSAVMSLGRLDLRRKWDIVFINERGVDAGGLTREWFHLVTKQIFDPDSGLWLSESASQQYVHINPLSRCSHPAGCSIYFRFLGRIIGRALFDQQLISGRMAPYIYKHLLGWPIMFHDLEHVDKDLYLNLMHTTNMSPGDIEVLSLDFTHPEHVLGVQKNVELIPDGKNVGVTKENLPQYLEAFLKYRLFDRFVSQLTELLLGIFDVVPEPLLAVFDSAELELLLCGVAVIDVDDWEENTKYIGRHSPDSDESGREVSIWFWDIVRNTFDYEMRARLLQFSTGATGVPSGGFATLQGMGGGICSFCIKMVDSPEGALPTASTCYNQLYLPLYSSKNVLFERLTFAITSCSEGFGMA